MPYKKNLYTGLGMMLFSVVYFALSFNIKPFKGIGATPLDSAFVPRMWGVCLFLLSLALTIRGLRERAEYKRTAPPADGQASFSAFLRKYYKVLLTFLFITVYIALLEPVGFFLTSACYITAQTLILSPSGKKNPLMAALVGLIAAGIIDYLFVVLLHVILPKGILGF